MKQFMVLIAVLVAAVLTISHLVPVPSVLAAGKEPAGMTLFKKHTCNMCHAVPAASIAAKTKSDSMKGPELGGKFDTGFKEIAAFVRKEADLDGESHKKPFKGTDEELQAIIDWLGSLEAK